MHVAPIERHFVCVNHVAGECTRISLHPPEGGVCGGERSRVSSPACTTGGVKG
jgi:hypothetical protein